MKTEKVKIWAVTEGPYSLEYLLEGKNYPYEIPPDCGYLVVCKVEKDEKIIDKEFWFEKKEDAFKFKSPVAARMAATVIYAPKLEDPMPFYLEYEDE